jgi:hypothetical protein
MKSYGVLELPALFRIILAFYTLFMAIAGYSGEVLDLKFVMVPYPELIYDFYYVI